MFLLVFFQIYRELRKREIIQMADQIVEGKRRKMMSGNDPKTKDVNEQNERTIKTSHLEEVESREDILEREFEKIRDIPRHQEIFQTFNCKLTVLSNLSIASEIETLC